MSFSEEYKQGLRGDGGHGVDVFSYSYQMGAQDRDRQIREGGGGGGNGGGGGGAIIGIFAVIVACCAFLIALISYPIAALITGITFVLGTVPLNSGAGMNFFGLVFALMIPCFIVFLFSFKLEKKLADFRPYRIFRQYWRIVVGTYIVYTLGTGLLRGGNAGFFEYFLHWGSALSAPALMYLNSMRLDKKYELDPIRFWWLDMIIDPIKDRLVPKVSSDLRETGVMRAKSIMAGEIDVQIANGEVTLGALKVPVGSIRQIEYDRENRGPLFAAGVVIPVILIVIIGKMSNGNFSGFFPQLFGFASLAFGAILIFFSAVKATPPGKLAGPFRSLIVWFSDPSTEETAVFLKFEQPKDERMFIQALENGLKALRNPEAAIAPVAANAPKLGPIRRLTQSFKF